MVSRPYNPDSVMGKYLTKPYQSFRVGVGLLTGYNAAHEEGDQLVHQLAGLDRVESPDWAETPHLWEEGAEPGPEYEDNQDL